ncbi:MAG: S-adenosylmethionine:tRNA ribosyltransferase-isomerase [Nitrospirales bacterium]
MSCIQDGFQISEQAVQTIQEAETGGGRVIAVGTTAAQAWSRLWIEAGRLTAQSGETRLFIIQFHSRLWMCC